MGGPESRRRGRRTAHAVVFDFDGTLIDTMGGFADLAGALIARQHGWSVADGRAAYLRTSGIPFFQQLDVLFPDDEANPRLAARFEVEKLRFYTGKGLGEDVAPTLAGLQKRGIASVVSSNNFSEVVERFLATQDASFTLVLGFERRSGFCKGEPHFAHAAAALGLGRGELLFVGDSVRDAELAEAGGVPFVARLGTVPAASFEARFGPDPFPMIERCDEVLPLLDRMAA